MRVVQRVGLGAALVALVATVYVFVADRRYNAAVEDARSFCEELVPSIEEHRKSAGVYPAAVDEAWYPGAVPYLIQADDFYLATGDGNSFIFRFRDPRIDPRYWFSDVHGYSSSTRSWQRYDGY